MLEEYKELYEQCANLYPDWKKISKNDLCRIYVRYNNDNNPNADSILSAIICKNWNLIEMCYKWQFQKHFNQMDCYDLVLNTLQEVLDKHVWDNPESALYGDKNAPERAISRTLQCRRINLHIKYTQRDKYKSNIENSSLDNAEENNYGTPKVLSYDPIFDEVVENSIKEYVTELFNKEEYLKSFTIDNILNQDVFESVERDDGKRYSEFSAKKLRKCLRAMNNDQCQGFSKYYNVDYQKVLEARAYILGLSYSKLSRSVDNTLKSLSSDKKLLGRLVEEC